MTFLSGLHKTHFLSTFRIVLLNALYKINIIVGGLLRKIFFFINFPGLTVFIIDNNDAFVSNLFFLSVENIQNINVGDNLSFSYSIKTSKACD
jgi:hypothetical protein